MKKVLWMALFVLAMCLTLAACKVTVSEDEKEVSFEDEEVSLAVGETYDVAYEVKNFEYDVLYADYDKTIISVDENGTVKGLKEGSTTLNVTIVSLTDDYTYSHSITIYVSEQRTVSISYTVSVEGHSIEGEVIKYGSNYTIKTADEIEGYTFLGFTLTKGSTDYITEIKNVKADTMVYANYEKIKKPVVTYMVNGEELTSETKEVEKGTKVDPTKVTVTESGFLGWISNQEMPVILTGEVEVNDDITFTAVFNQATYNVSYNLNGGEWEKTYYTIDELATMFLKDYNANGGSTSKPEYLDTAYLGSNTFAAAMSSKTCKANWMWLYKALCEKAGKMSTLNPETTDLTSTSAKSFYISELCGFFTKSQHTDSNYGTTSVDYSQIEYQNEIIEQGPVKSEAAGPSTYKKGSTTALTEPVRLGYEFQYWTIGKDQVSQIESTFKGDITLTANWKQAQLPETIEFTNIPELGIDLYEGLQLTWKVGPNNAYDTQVYFQALTPSIFTIDEKGYVSTISKGEGKFKVKFVANASFEQIVTINVVSGDYFDISYETTSYTTVGNKIKLNSVYYDNKEVKQSVTWSSLTPSIATVDTLGNVTPIAVGLATIRSTYDEDHYIDFVVTVLDKDISDELQFILNNHNSNALVAYNIDVAGIYKYDVVGSANDILFDKLKYDYTYYDKLPSGTKNYGPMSSVEFITVHYTGNPGKGADADNNVDYFNNLSYAASIHYVTGRSNLYSSYSEDQYYAFAGLNEKYGGWHASTGSNQCVWDATGVMYSSSDPEETVISISANNKYTINGKETQISIPSIPDGYTVNGNELTVGGKKYTTINSMGLISKVENGQYYIARTYWGSQRSPKALCTYGGNTNSIGIESCVDIGSDLMHTWHVTAQLVAQLLIKYNLGFDRVVGHHFFSGKDCPQPLLENDMQLWYEFMDMVKAEYAILTTYKDVTFTAKAVKDEGILSDKGLLKQDAQSHVVTYEVTIEKNGVKQTVTLATAVESYYCYDGTRSQLSLQNQKYTII